MTTRVTYRIAAGLIFLLALGHTSGCPWSDPAWGVDLAAIRSSHFKVFGFTRTYWDFYVGFGLEISVFLLLTAVLAWQLGGVSVQALAQLRATAWVLALAFVALTILSWMYFFAIPIAFVTPITVFLVLGAWRASKAA